MRVTDQILPSPCFRVPLAAVRVGPTGGADVRSGSVGAGGAPRAQSSLRTGFSGALLLFWGSGGELPSGPENAVTCAASGEAFVRLQWGNKNTWSMIA